MADPYFPDVQVDIAFNAGYTTPAASRTWTDVSAYVELAQRIQIAFGRQDERSTADANTLTLTLDNTDGRFTAGRAASPYSPNVKIGRPIRVRVTPVGGSTVTRFVGFIDEWPVEWDGSDRYAKATIRATSRMSRLGLSTKMRSMMEQAVMAPSPLGYWTLGDPSGSTQASESSGNSLPPMTLTTSSGGTVPPTFGAGVGVPTDDLTAMVCPPDSISYEGSLPGLTIRTLRATFLSTTGTFTNNVVAVTSATGAVLSSSHDGNFSGTPYVLRVGGVTTVTATPDVLHDLVLTSSVADGLRVYLDGVQVYTAAGTDYTNMTSITLGYGSNPDRSITLCHVAIYDVILTPAQVATQATAIFGFAGERTDLRLTRILGWAGVAASEVTTEVGQELMTYQKTSGQSFTDALREVESTESGVLYDRADGNVGFHNRSHRYATAAAATLNMASQHVGADYAPKLDRAALANDVTVSNPTTEQSARSTSGASVAEYGVASTSSTATASSADALLQKANWLTASYSTPRTRVPSLTVDVLAHQGLTPSAQTLLGITVGDLLAVTNAPTQSDTTSPKYYVEGYTETIGPESYEISYNLSPTYPTLNVLVLNDATRGQLDAGNVLAL